MSKQQAKYLFTVTHYESDSDRVATPFVWMGASAVLAAAQERQAFSF